MAADTPAGKEAASVVIRILAATLGGYAATYTLTAAAAAALHRGGFNKVDSALVSTNLAIVVYPAIMIWAFGARRGWVVLAATAAGSGLLALAAWALIR
jgi:hypothetical protein